MPITSQQIQAAETEQDRAAHEQSQATRVVAGPGTGKSRSIEKRVQYLLTNRVRPENIFVISFTRASTADLQQRVVDFCSSYGQAIPVVSVSVSTMHSLALRALRQGNLIGPMFPADPTILDLWEQLNIFDREFALAGTVTPGRAREVRVAFEAYWQTLQQAQLSPVSHGEQTNFRAFHPFSTTLYSCLLPGEIVRRCVDHMRRGDVEPASLLGIRELIVDEYQDLNECDQEFVSRIHSAGARLWVAGDDDQSIYSFRHAAPSGIRNFLTKYLGSSDHSIDACFRCTPAVLDAAQSLVSHNSNRLNKSLYSLYLNSSPPIAGRTFVWRFSSGGREAAAISQSCRDLIDAGFPAGDIAVLICNRRVQLSLIRDELASRSVPYIAPTGQELSDSGAGRVVMSLIRIIANQDDYVAHRTLLGLIRGVGNSTCRSIGVKAASANLNFRDLFYMPIPQGVFDRREEGALAAASGWVA
jgi:DNA helicase-2/ATP-dependent DNA helicase PcrA